MMKENATREIIRERLEFLKGDEFSGQAFADRLGISRQTMGFWLRGERTPSAENIVDISKACGVSADYLLGLAEKTDHSPEISFSDVVRYTGLTPNAVYLLNELSKSKRGKRYCDLISSFVQVSAFQLEADGKRTVAVEGFEDEAYEELGIGIFSKALDGNEDAELIRAEIKKEAE